MTWLSISFDDLSLSQTLSTSREMRGICWTQDKNIKYYLHQFIITGIYCSYLYSCIIIWMASISLIKSKIWSWFDRVCVIWSARLDWSIYQILTSVTWDILTWIIMSQGPSYSNKYQLLENTDQHVIFKPSKHNLSEQSVFVVVQGLRKLDEKLTP